MLHINRGCASQSMETRSNLVPQDTMDFVEYSARSPAHLLELWTGSAPVFARGYPQRWPRGSCDVTRSCQANDTLQ